EILHRRPHGPSAASYLPHGADAAVGNKTQNFIIRNRYSFPIRIDGTAQDGALTIAVYRAD
ncbi:MAG TPA: VanW family protein, partial [Clostridia bacterium]|nr:VanW family protein [Clostridia bacterium]